jgi:hypothetical protein
MRKKLIVVLTLAVGMYAASAKAATLKTGAYYCDSKEDVELSRSLASEKDNVAVMQMMADGKLLGPTSEAQTVTITNASDYKIIGFRIRGDTTVYWALNRFIVN